MNIKQFHKIIPGESRAKFPIELAYGYTFDRKSLHIVLYKDKLSRVVTNGQGKVIERDDQVDEINMKVILRDHKRFYPNRFHPVFKAMLDSFNVPRQITNHESTSDPILEFKKVVVADFSIEYLGTGNWQSPPVPVLSPEYQYVSWGKGRTAEEAIKHAVQSLQDDVDDISAVEMGLDALILEYNKEKAPRGEYRYFTIRYNTVFR